MTIMVIKCAVKCIRKEQYTMKTEIERKKSVDTSLSFVDVQKHGADIKCRPEIDIK
jgi:hypothetical protein